MKISSVSLRDTIIMHALKDSAFKEQLHNNPKETISALAKDHLDIKDWDAFNKWLDTTTFNIIDEKENSMTIVLPHVSAEMISSISAMNDAELAQVAAGFCMAAPVTQPY